MTGEPRTDQAYVESHESEYITPKDAVAAKAQADVYNVETVLHSAGIPLEQIHAAADLNAKNARSEFEAKQQEDPIRRIAGILEKSPAGGRDQEVIQKQIQQMEFQRTTIQTAVNRERTQARISGKPEPSLDDALQKIIRSNSLPMFTEGNSVELAILQAQFLPITDGNVNSKNVKPSDACLTKIMTGIGVLDQGETSNDFKLFRQSETPGPNEPQRDLFGSIKNLPTNMEGVTARINLDQSFIALKFPLSTLNKIAAFPASV